MLRLCILPRSATSRRRSFYGQSSPAQTFCSFSSFFAGPFWCGGRDSGARGSRASRGSRPRIFCNALIHRPGGKSLLEFRGTLCLGTAESASASAHRPRGSAGNSAILFPDGLHSQSRVLCSLASGRYSKRRGFEDLAAAVEGNVAKPVSYSLADLIRKFPAERLPP